MPQVLLDHRLNGPLRGYAAIAMVLSAVSVSPASIGPVQLPGSIRATSALIAAVPTWNPAAERADILCVA